MTYAMSAGELAAGAVSLEHVQAVVRCLDPVAAHVPPAALAAGEVFLLEHAKILDPSRLGRAGREVAHRLDPDVADRLARGEESAVERRELFLSENSWTGMWDLRATLDPLTGAALRAELEARSAPRPATEDGPDPRNPTRRRADAFCDLVDGARRLPDPVPGPRAPVQLILTTELETLRGAPERPGQTIDGTWLSPALIRELAGDADIVPVVLGGKSEPLDVGRSRYVVPVAIRRALTARDQGCSAPGCARPSGWCDAHHITHWATGGETKLKNLTLVCSFHHHTAHHDGGTSPSVTTTCRNGSHRPGSILREDRSEMLASLFAT